MIEKTNKNNFFLIKKQEISNYFLKNKLTDKEIKDTFKEEIINFKKQINEIEEILLKTNQFRKKSKEHWDNFNFISLGSQCQPRTLLTKFGLKKSKSDGELSCPFDLSISPHNTVAKTINSNFDDFFYGLHDLPDGSIKNQLGQIFNHEKESVFKEKNYYAFIERYKKRINNFNQLSKLKNTFFVIQTSEIKKTHSLLKSIIRKDLSKNIIIINEGEVEKNNETYYRFFSLNIKIINIKTPYKNYIWHKGEHAITKEGLDYETSIINKIDLKEKSIIIEKDLIPKIISDRGYITPDDVDILRDLALKNEKKNVSSSFILMLLAASCRPNGPLINKKIIDYKKTINDSE